ncbi:MAG: BolA/IbaG family iron-sulfur metabolism protein [Gammaproteobacteria bacterium]
MNGATRGDWSALHDHLIHSFPGSWVNLIDETDRHRNHVGHPYGFHNLELKMISPEFCNMPLIERHRRIYRAIGPLENWRLHAIQIQASAPDESALHSVPTST